MASAQVRLPQVSQVEASGDVALWLAESEVVAAWFGAGSPHLPYELDLEWAPATGREVLLLPLGRASIHLTGLPTGFGLGGQGVNTISPGPIVASGIALVTVSVPVEIASMVELGPPMPSCA
jgi:hypothetical protein